MLQSQWSTTIEFGWMGDAETERRLLSISTNAMRYFYSTFQIRMAPLPHLSKTWWNWCRTKLQIWIKIQYERNAACRCFCEGHKYVLDEWINRDDFTNCKRFSHYSPLTGNRRLTVSVFFVVLLKKLWNKQWGFWWFEPPWRHVTSL